MTVSSHVRDLIDVQVSVRYDNLVSILERHNREINACDVRLTEHDNQIAEILKRLQSIPTRQELDKFRTDLQNAVDKHRDLERRVSVVMVGSDDQDKQVKDFQKQLEGLRGKLKGLKRSVKANHTDLTRVIKEYAAVTGVSVGQLEKTTEVLRDHLGNDEFDRFRTLVREWRQDCLNHRVKAPGVGGGTGTSESSLFSIDLSKYQLGKAERFEIGQPATLPELTRFAEIGQSVGHIYQVQPRLQAILDAFNNELIRLRDVADTSGLRELMERIREMIGRLADDVEDLKKAQSRGMTRADVLKLISHDDDETAIGAVRCIACGRDMRQVIGALPEQEAVRALGDAPVSRIVPGRQLAVYDHFVELEKYENPARRAPASARRAKGA